MSGIVLSASVRQNLLSLQSTAALLATTQNDLATGKKVNTALDNPTNYFTAQGLDNRASDISNLLDGIGNGVQVLQAANTGITSLQSLVASAQSIANQVLQSPVGYSTKSNVTSAAITGATANNLLGTAGDERQRHRYRCGPRQPGAPPVAITGATKLVGPLRPGHAGRDACERHRPLPSTARPSPSAPGNDGNDRQQRQRDDRRRRRQHADDTERARRDRRGSPVLPVRPPRP